MAYVPYEGAAGRTRKVETTIWCGGCGAWFGAVLIECIDAETDPALVERLLADGLAGLHRADCPACGWSYVAEAPIAVHHAPSETLFLYIPPSCRHRAQQTRAAWVAAVAAAPGKQVPDYALSPRLIDGLDALAGLIAPVEPTRVAEAPEVEAPVAEAPSARPSGLLAALLDEDDEAPASAAPDEWAISAEAWQLAEPPDEPARHEPTHVVHSDAVIGDVEAGPRFEAELAVDGVSYVTLDGGRVVAAAKASPEQVTALLTTDAELRFQRHATPDGDALCLTLFFADAGLEPLLWVLDAHRPAHVAALDTLERMFRVDVRGFDAEGRCAVERMFDPPLARNVTQARARAADRAGEREAVTAHLRSGAVDLAGQMRHNFDDTSFAALPSAAEAQLALGIVSYWSNPDRYAYLVDVQCFPVVWFEAMVRRVLGAALEFGLALEPHMQARALSLRLAEDEVDLLRRALASFVEVNLNLRRNELDPIDLWENWAALLGRAEELGVGIDAQIEELAVRAMKAAEEIDEAQDDEAPDESEEAMELDLDDAIEVELIDEAPSADWVPPIEPRVEVGALDDATLLARLDEPGERADAVAELLRRGEALYAPALFEALGVMTADELVVAVPAAVEHPEAFAAFFADAMTESDPPLRWAAILYLMDRGHPVPDTALDELPAATAMAGSLADRLRLVMGAGVYGGTDPLDLT